MNRERSLPQGLLGNDASDDDPSSGAESPLKIVVSRRHYGHRGRSRFSSGIFGTKKLRAFPGY